MEGFSRQAGEVRKQIRVNGRKINFFWNPEKLTFRLPPLDPEPVGTLDEARSRVADRSQGSPEDGGVNPSD